MTQLQPMTALAFRLIWARLLPLAFGLAAGTALAAAPPDQAPAEARFEVLIRPDTGPDGKVTGLTLTEQIRRPAAGQPFSLAAPLSLAGLVPIASAVTGLQVSDEAGEVGMTAADMTLAEDEPGRRWTAQRPVGAHITVRYRLPVQPVAGRGPPYGVKAAGLGLAGNSSTLLLLPEGVPATSSTLAWDLGAMPKGAVGVATGGWGQFTVQGPPQALLDRWLLAGPAQAAQAAEGPGFNAYTVGTPPFDAAAMMAWSRSAYAVLAQAFGYLGAPRYELLIRALDAPSFATGPAALAGGGSLITVGQGYTAGQDERSVQSLIFHEMGHQWVGQFDGGGSLWFAEGLNVYVSVTLPCQAGLQPWSACAQEISRTAKDHYTSEGRHWPQAAVERAGFGREDIRRVSYGRGMLYFAELDATLRARSAGRRGILDALRPLFAARHAGHPITPALWDDFLRRELGPEAVATFHRVMDEGTDVTLSPGAFGPSLQRRPMQWTLNGAPQEGYEWVAR